MRCRSGSEDQEGTTGARCARNRLMLPQSYARALPELEGDDVTALLHPPPLPDQSYLWVAQGPPSRARRGGAATYDPGWRGASWDPHRMSRPSFVPYAWLLFLSWAVSASPKGRSRTKRAMCGGPPEAEEYTYFKHFKTRSICYYVSENAAKYRVIKRPPYLNPVS